MCLKGRLGWRPTGKPNHRGGCGWKLEVFTPRGNSNNDKMDPSELPLLCSWTWILLSLQCTGATSEGQRKLVSWLLLGQLRGLWTTPARASQSLGWTGGEVSKPLPALVQVCCSWRTEAWGPLSKARPFRDLVVYGYDFDPNARGPGVWFLVRELNSVCHNSHAITKTQCSQINIFFLKSKTI